MKLIFIYGPPAVGKLTVASALGGRTGYRLFHNHATVDAVTPVFEHGSPPFARVLRRIRLIILEAAIQEGVEGVIFTKVYTFGTLELVKEIEALGAEICPVRLYCEPQLLDERVTAENRRKYDKLHTVEGLHAKLAELEQPFLPLPGRASLSLDTGSLTPSEAAARICAHFNL